MQTTSFSVEVLKKFFDKRNFFVETNIQVSSKNQGGVISSPSEEQVHFIQIASPQEGGSERVCIGEILLGADFSLRHRDDAAVAKDTLRFYERPEAAREIATGIGWRLQALLVTRRLF